MISDFLFSPILSISVFEIIVGIFVTILLHVVIVKWRLNEQDWRHDEENAQRAAAITWLKIGARRQDVVTVYGEKNVSGAENLLRSIL